MKTTKNNCHGTKSCSNKTTTNKTTTGGCCGAKKNEKTSSKKSADESDADPSGSYTGNPVGWGKYAKPVQDVDDL